MAAAVSHTLSMRTYVPCACETIMSLKRCTVHTNWWVIIVGANFIQTIFICHMLVHVHIAHNAIFNNLVCFLLRVYSSIGLTEQPVSLLLE